MCCDLTHARTHALRGRQTQPHAGYGIHLSSYVCTIINKSEIAMLQTQSSEYQTRREEGSGRPRVEQGAPMEGGSQLATISANNKDSCHCNT